MYSFLISVVALILGYLFYGALVDRIFGPNPARVAPSVKKNDGVDFVAMPNWKVYMIQFLNIAGTGPIFGAIMGAKFGPSAYLWIVLGSIFAGGVHDYFSGMLSVRHEGGSMPFIVGHYLGRRTKKLMLVFSLVLLLLTGTVFVYSPSIILNNLAGTDAFGGTMMWVFVILIYYIFATLLPVDKLIGKIYPLFAFALLFMTVSLTVCLLLKWPSIPEVWQGLGNRGVEAGLFGDNPQPIYPYIFITIACGALSGFHSTQCPIMARCLKNEKMGRPIFYGAMITEGIVALVWTAVSSYFFYDGGAAEVGSSLKAAAPEVVTSVSKSWLGIFGGILAILGVVAAPITSGDTAFRSARLTLAEFFHMDQKPRNNRLVIAVPIFAVTALLLWFNIADADGFNVIWRYFGLANQTLACLVLWSITVYLTINKKDKLYYLLTLPVAAFVSAFCMTYVCISDEGFNISDEWSLPISIITFFAGIALFYLWKYRKKHSR